MKEKKSAETAKEKVIAIVGRPNVGKSTLFNRLVGRRIALVHDQPGMTRDRKEGKVNLFGLSFKIIDTAGLADPESSILTQKMIQQTMNAVDEADLVLFVIDGREGCTPHDEELARELRRKSKPIVLLVNKCEGNKGQQGFVDALGLGLGDAIALSAEHGEGLGDLHDRLLKYFPESNLEEEEDEHEEDTDEEEITFGMESSTKSPEMLEGSDELHTPEAETDEAEQFAQALKEDEKFLQKPLNLAIVGRPNVGKSTLINRLIGEERLLTGDMPGVTRDSIAIEWQYQGREIRLVDTAGLRKQSRVIQGAERLSVMDTERSIQYAEAVVLVIDATMPLEKQDLHIAAHVIEEGRALVLAINKWDLIDDKAAALKEINRILSVQLAQCAGVPVIPVSALEGKSLHRIFDAVFEQCQLWNRRLPTATLNRWLDLTTQHHPAPTVSGRRIRLKYMTQIKTRPPTFVVFVTQIGELPESYTRYLINQLRKDFDMPGVPIRLYYRASAKSNPYGKSSK